MASGNGTATADGASAGVSLQGDGEGSAGIDGGSATVQVQRFHASVGESRSCFA